MKKIKMLDKKAGSPNGTLVRMYEKGTAYNVPDDIPESLAWVFVHNGWAEEEKVRGRPKTKNAPPAPENKSRSGQLKRVGN